MVYKKVRGWISGRSLPVWTLLSILPGANKTTHTAWIYRSREYLLVIHLELNVAWSIILIGRPSLFESLLRKQIDLYCKTIMTHGLQLDLTLLWSSE